jgi:hypothetical protein
MTKQPASDEKPPPRAAILQATALSPPGEGLRRWLLSCSEGHATSELELTCTFPHDPGQSMHGVFQARRGSDPAPFLAALLQAHGEVSVMTNVPQYDTLPFAGRTLGHYMRWRGPAALGPEAFDPDPLGDWRAADITLDRHARLVIGINEMRHEGALVAVAPGYAWGLFSGFFALWQPLGGAA